MNAVVSLEFPGGLDTLPRRCDFDEDTLLLDTNRFVKRDELFGLGDENEGISTFAELRVRVFEIIYLFLGAFLVKGKTSIDLRRHTAGDNSKNFFTEFDELNEGGGEKDGDNGSTSIHTKRSRAALACSSRVLPLVFPYLTATSMRRAYSDLLAAAKIREGLVVASYSVCTMICDKPLDT